MAEPDLQLELEVRIDYGQIYIYDQASPGADLGSDSPLDALSDSERSGLRVGSAAGLLDVLSPVQWNSNAPMRVECWPDEPTSDDDNWDDVVDIDFDAPSGQLTFQESGGGYEPTSCEVPPGRYRARVSGRGYDTTQRSGGGMDCYRLQLWPRRSNSPGEARRVWPGWAARR